MRGRGGCLLVEARSPTMAAHTESLQHPLLSDGQYGITPDAFGREIATHKGGDVPPITSLKQFGKEGWIESKKLWSLAGPAIFTAICQYSLGAITQTFAGHLGTVELAAVAIENSAIGGLAFGFMWILQIGSHPYIEETKPRSAVKCDVMPAWKYKILERILLYAYK